MKQKKQEQEKFEQPNSKKVHDEQNQLEIHKAVAQAWHSHSNNARVATSEFDARRRNFQGTSSRFKLESMKQVKDYEDVKEKNVEWDFNESLWDSYEILAVSKKLETGLVLDYNCNDVEKIGESNRVFRRRKESKNSLRNLFNIMSSRRYTEDHQVSHQQTS